LFAAICSGISYHSQVSGTDIKDGKRNTVFKSNNEKTRGNKTVYVYMYDII
jgi:hypothetical protein